MPERALAHLVPNLARCRHDGVPDDELVDRYTREQDEEAFTELVRRHGPMVWSVGRRVLRNSADADDAFQATFLVLARKAGSICPAGSVGRWLHGVALRTAKEALRRAARRRAKEGRVVPREEMPEVALHDVRPILDAELDRLPEAFAQVLILCDMEGRTRPEAAALLRVPEGTVASRLSRARDLLAERLTRRGVALTVGTVAAAVAADARAAPPPELLAGTAKAAFAFGTGRAAEAVSPGALTLANAVLRAAGARFKFLVAGLAVTAAAVTGWAATTDPPHQPQRPEPVAVVSSPAPTQPPAPDPAVLLREKLTGLWRVDEGTRDDRPLTDWEKGGFQFDFNSTGVLKVYRGQLRDQRVFAWAVEPTAASPAIVLTPPDGGTADAVRVSFEFRADTLTLSWDEPPAGRGLRGDRTTATKTATCRVTLSKVAAAGAPGGPVVTSSPHNVVGSRLVGAWETDGELNKKLGLARAATGEPGTVTLTFTSDPTVARDVPEGYRTLFADRRVYLAGRMTVTGSAGGPAAYRFLLIEHLGNATLVYFVPRNGNEWSCEEAATIMLAPGAERENDLLFLTAPVGATHAPAGSFRRVAEKK